MPIWLVKFLASKFSGYLAIALLLAITGWGLYAGLIRPVTKPNPTAIQNGGTSYTIHVGLGGCARIPSPNEIRK